MVGAERPIENALLPNQNACDLGLSVELEEGLLCPRTYSLWGCGEFVVEEGDNQEDFPTTMFPLYGRVSEFEERDNPEVDPLDQRYGPSCSHVSTSPSSSSFLDRVPSMEGLFGPGEFSVDGEGSGKENDSNWAFPFVSKESCEAVEEKGLKEAPVLIEDTFPH